MLWEFDAKMLNHEHSGITEVVDEIASRIGDSNLSLELRRNFYEYGTNIYLAARNDLEDSCKYLEDRNLLRCGNDPTELIK